MVNREEGARQMAVIMGESGETSYRGAVQRAGEGKKRR